MSVVGEKWNTLFTVCRREPGCHMLMAGCSSVSQED